jgi:hypothetical protein
MLEIPLQLRKVEDEKKKINILEKQSKVKKKKIKKTLYINT